MQMRERGTGARVVDDGGIFGARGNRMRACKLVHGWSSAQVVWVVFYHVPRYVRLLVTSGVAPGDASAGSVVCGALRAINTCSTVSTSNG